MVEKIIYIALQKIVGEVEFDLEIPARSENGDYSTNVAMKLFANLKNKQQDLEIMGEKFEVVSPRSIAELIRDKLSKDEELSTYISKIEVAGSGFVNFYLNNAYLINVIKEVLAKGSNYGKKASNNGKRAIVEYSSPNIAKPFTIGHLRSTVIGDAYANMLEMVGWEVLRDNHLGDWGTQFGKQIYAIKAWGSETEIEKSENPVKDLVALYVRFHKEAETNPELEDKAREWFKKLESGDEEVRRLWLKCIDWSFREFSKIYNELGVKFSEKFNGGRGLGESFFEDKMHAVIEELDNKSFLKVGEGGAKLVFFDNDKYPPAMILKKDGSTLYHTRDLATDKYRKDNFDPDLIVNEVGAEQQLYFKQLFEMEKMLGWFDLSQRVHLFHGMFRFKDRKMSTRKGNVIWLEEVLEQAISRAREMGSKVSETAKIIGIGAIKWNDLKHDPKADVVFDWDEILNMQGNSGPYMQYTYARCMSVLEKSGSKSVGLSSDGTYQLNADEREITTKLSQYSGTILIGVKNYSPSVICTYLYNLASTFNKFYNSNKIVGSDNEELRLALTKATATVIKSGLDILGIQAPERM
ncbi:arginine--tRNA ligase [Candidatus Woesebacteria bacterium]|nr:MAG: arginine--tRNA ligase [Candidatus Woesebacteria bacterium]